jgi:hypothetical protein
MRFIGDLLASRPVTIAFPRSFFNRGDATRFAARRKDRRLLRMPRAASHPITVQPAATRTWHAIGSPGIFRAGSCVACILLLSAAAPEAATQPAAVGPTGVVAAAGRSLASGLPEDVQMAAACGADGPYRDVRIFGSGAGIWKRSAQFAVPRDLLQVLLEAFQEADFDRLPPILGGSVDPDEARRGPRIICQASLTAGSITKEVVQLEKGAQSKALWTLANTILDLCEKHAVSGIAASSLEDGLDKIADGRLARESLELTVHHRPEGTSGRGNTGWILHVEGGTARVDDYSNPTTSRRRVRLRLPASDLTVLVRALQDQDVAALPGNVFAEGYTDVHVGVLNRERQVQAREFTGLTAEAQARGRIQFERLLSVFSALYRRVVEEGQPLP